MTKADSTESTAIISGIMAEIARELTSLCTHNVEPKK